MCGIAGIVETTGSRGTADLARSIASMTAALAHRGPDRQATWTGPQQRVALGHTRLAIVDLSAAGDQPMVSADGRLVLTYNGELYNAGELRAELEGLGHRFRGHADTEVLLAGCVAWGVEACLHRTNGMFAFGLWNEADRCLTLARDRLGEKPLYWGCFGGRLLFASEIKALRAHPGWSPEIDPEALASYLRWRSVPAPRTIYRGLQKLRPGHLLEWRPRTGVRIRPYWDPVAIAARGALELDDDEAVDRLDGLLRDAVGRRMVADVPLGGFLSGGINSSLVTALMQAQSRVPVRTFSIGFREGGFDEAPHARAVAAHLGTDHTELYVTPGQAQEVIPRLPRMFDEPFADASQIPTALLAALTRRHVTVALSGDGGDELFGGYRRYQEAARAWRRLCRVPPLGRRLAAGLFPLWPSLLRTSSTARAVTPDALLPMWERLDYWGRIAGAPDGGTFYTDRCAQWRDPAALLLGAVPDAGAEPAAGARPGDLLDQMQMADLQAYLPDDVLTKVDRATMAVALEARVPLLDHRVVELALRLPRRLRVRDGVGKWALRRVLGRYVPDALVDRPKAGFSVPLAGWLRGPLRDWAEDLLDPRRLRAEGLLEPRPIIERWRQHQAGHRDWHAHLWTILMLEAWLREERTVVPAVSPEPSRPWSPGAPAPAPAS